MIRGMIMGMIRVIEIMGNGYDKGYDNGYDKNYDNGYDKGYRNNG